MFVRRLNLLWSLCLHLTVAWLLALSGLSTLFTWGSVCLCQYVQPFLTSPTHSHKQSSIRFRAAWKAQGHSIEELPYQAIGGTYGSWLGVTLIVLVLIAQFYVAIWPIGESVSGTAAAESFFSAFNIPSPRCVLYN